MDDKIILKQAESIFSIGDTLKGYAQNYKSLKRKIDEREEAWKKHVEEKYGCV